MFCPWTFSPSSKMLLQRCISAAAPQNEERKWTLAFGKKHLKAGDLDHIVTKTSDNITEEEPIMLPDSIKEPEPVVVPFKIDDEFFDVIVTEPIAKFEYIVKESLRNPILVTVLAEKLPVAVIEKICNHLFEEQEVCVEFLNHFYQNFIPVFLKRECTRFSLDLLVRFNTAYPLLFRKLLGILLKDVEIPNNILQDYVQSLKGNDKTIFTNILYEIELNSKEFVHNIFTIYTVYKDSKKTDSIQSYILYNLIQHSQECISEKNYGRLLHTYLQVQKNMGPMEEYRKIENIIENHRSPFKKPCMNSLTEILDKYKD